MTACKKDHIALKDNTVHKRGRLLPEDTIPLHIAIDIPANGIVAACNGKSIGECNFKCSEPHKQLVEVIVAS